jgi:DNA replication protein DnaC
MKYEEFYNAIEKDIVVKCKELLEKALNEVGFGPEQIDKVIMTGGSCKNPFIQEMLNEIFDDAKFCEHLASLGFDNEAIKENISFIIDYYNDYKVCIKCKNPNECALGEHYIKRVNYKDGMLEFEYDICNKYKKINRVKNLSYVCDVADSYLTKSLNTDLDKHQVRGELIKKLFDIYMNKSSKFIFVHSKKRSGGTFLTSLFYKEIVAKHSMTGAFVDAPKRFSELADLFFNNKAEFTRKLEELKTAEILVINKLSNFNFNEFIRNNVLYPILESRASENLTTIITSELKYEDLLSILNVKNSFKDVRYTQIKDILDEFEKVNISLNIKFY